MNARPKGTSSAATAWARSASLRKGKSPRRSSWTEEEGQRLRGLRLSPWRSNRNDLVALVRHFKEGGPLYSVHEAGKPVHASQDFARKVRGLTQRGALDWLLGVTSAGIAWQEPSAGAEKGLQEGRRHDGHRDILLPPLLNLKEVQPYSVHDFDLATWYLRDEASWPIPKGRAHLRGRSLSITLHGEDTLEVAYLRQHLEGHPLWNAMAAYKAAEARSLIRRRALFGAILQKVQRPQAEGDRPAAPGGPGIRRC